MKKLQVYLTTLFIVLLQCFIASGAGATEPAPNEVILYEAVDFIGDSESFKLPPGLPYWGTPVGNKLHGKVSSIRIGSDVGVFLFERGDFKSNHSLNTSHCWHNFKDSSHPGEDTNFPWYKGLEFFSPSHNTKLLECNDFYNGLIIYDQHAFEGLIGAQVYGWKLKEYYYPLFLYPPHTSSHCFDLQDDIYFSTLRIIRPGTLEHKVTAIVFKQNSCAGEGVAFPGSGSNMKYFGLYKYTFSDKDRPQSILVTYEGPYNHYKSKIPKEAPPSKEPQWIEADTDRPGKDFRNFWMMHNSSQICREACEKDANCKAYTYVPPGLSGNPSKARCWLKHGVPQPVSRKGMVSGVKRFFDHATKAPDGTTTGPGILLPHKLAPGKAGVAQADAIMSFHLVETKGDHLTFEVDYSVEPSHGNTVFIGGWIYDNKGQGISGYKPISVTVPGPGKGRLEVTVDTGQGHRGKEIEFFLYEPNKGPFIKKRFPLNMRLPAASTQPPKVEMGTGYVTTQKGGQQVDLSGTWNSNIGLVYKISQNGNKISYEDPMMHKPVNGTVDGKTVTVSWAEGNTLKSLKGTITSVGKDGKAKRINWANGVIFQR